MCYFLHTQVETNSDFQIQDMVKLNDSTLFDYFRKKYKGNFIVSVKNVKIQEKA